MTNDDQQRKPRRPGRTFGMVTFGVVVGVLTAVMSGQILIATFAPEAPELSTSCDSALPELWSALQRARQSAAGQSGAEASIEAFRESLQPEWQKQASVAQTCGKAPSGVKISRELIALRYAEERSVRLEGASIAHSRQRVGKLISSIPTER